MAAALCQPDQANSWKRPLPSVSFPWIQGLVGVKNLTLLKGAKYGTLFFVGKSPEKIWKQVQKNTHNLRFRDFCHLVEWFGFVRKGGKGSHQTYFHGGVREILDLQPLRGEAKPYQIKQFLRLIQIYKLDEEKNL